MPPKYDERAVETTLSGGIDASTTTIPLTSLTGYPSPTGGDIAYMTLDYDDAALIETISYTGRSGNTISGVVRGMGKNGAKSHASGAKVRHGAPDVELESIGNKVSLTGNETVAGVKTFSSIPVLPASSPTTDNQAARKKYVDDSVAAVTGTQTAQGSYTGDNTNSRTIALSFTPKYVVVNARSTGTFVYAFSPLNGQDIGAYFYGSVGATGNAYRDNNNGFVPKPTTNGFLVSQGGLDGINVNAVVYDYFAIG